jgi:hypothetical protein
MRIAAPVTGSVVDHASLAGMRRLPVMFTCDAVPGAVHRLLLNSDVYLQWNEHHLQSLDADFGVYARGRRFRLRRAPSSPLPHARAHFKRWLLQFAGSWLAAADAAATATICRNSVGFEH